MSQKTGFAHAKFLNLLQVLGFLIYYTLKIVNLNLYNKLKMSLSVSKLSKEYNITYSMPNVNLFKQVGINILLSKNIFLF